MLYLASRSPQRSNLLQQAGIAFVVVDSTADEEAIVLPHPQGLAIERARAKAEAAVLTEYLGGWQAGDAVLAADTVVSLGPELFGKPTDDDDAKRMLRALSGTTHVVSTAHCVLVPARGEQPGQSSVGVSMAKITMRPWSDDEIDAYVASGESRERAGAYAIQENADTFVVEREGSFDTVVGLNVASVRNLYHEVTQLDLDGKDDEA